MLKKIRKAVFKFKPFSKKQLKVLTWWLPESLVSDKDGIIADGVIRSGKTLSMSLSFYGTTDIDTLDALEYSIEREEIKLPSYI